MEKPKNKEPMLLSFCWVHIDRKGLRDGVSKIHEFVRAYSSCSSCTATQRGRCSIGESYYMEMSDSLVWCHACFPEFKTPRLRSSECTTPDFAVATAFVAGTGDCKDDF